MSVLLFVEDTTWKSICRKKRRITRQRLRVCAHEVSKRATDQLFFFVFIIFPSILSSSSSRFENATKCKSSHVLQLFSLVWRNNCTNCLYCSSFIPIDHKYDFDFVVVLRENSIIECTRSILNILYLLETGVDEENVLVFVDGSILITEQRHSSSLIRLKPFLQVWWKKSTAHNVTLSMLEELRIFEK